MPSPSSPEPAPRCRVLVVDDVVRNLQVVGTMLRQEGYEVMPAASGDQALDRLRHELPDLVLLDLMMPGMDGIEVCRRLKADPATRALPVIFLTASNEMDHLVNAFAAGAVDYITKPFNAPELLARVRTHLELKLARERLREMNDEKNEFMGIAAHDLRSPLTAMKGYLEMIAEDPAMARAELEDLVSRMSLVTRRMVDMVQNLLDVNAIERGERIPKPRACDFRELVLGVVESHKPRAAAKDQPLVLEAPDSPLHAQLDPGVVTQVVENLLSNAIKYSPSGKPVRVRVSQEGASLQCAVQDEGPGLTAEDQKRLFGKFARLSARPTGGESSVGLGLSIVKRMVEAMGGEVRCTSAPGQGATFTVTLPALPPPTTA